jgi:hypothetical protein
MTDHKVCLIITFNSPFAANIPILSELYKSRFDKIYFLIHKPEGYQNALRINGESFYFHNYFLQNLEQIRGYDYYVFTHDDAILHPRLNKHDLWERFSIPENALCVRNIDLVPRDSSWNWAWHGGYEVVDNNPQLRDLVNELHPHLCKSFLKYVAPFHQSKYSDPEKIIREQGPPLLFGGGANGDLMFMPGLAMERLMEKVSLLNFPGFFVEIVIPMAILLTDWPIYLLRTNPHAPIHNPRRGFILSKLGVITLLNRMSYHPIKFGMAHPLARKSFISLYGLIRRLGD